MTKSTQTLTQSGLLAVLLQRQRYIVFQLARRSARRKRVHAAFWNTLTWARRALTVPRLVDGPAPHLKLHDDLRIKYPEWVEPNGESSMCLMEVLDTLTRRGIQRVYRYSSPRLRTGTKPDRHRAGVIRPEVN
jgi:hypothetical protein